MALPRGAMGLSAFLIVVFPDHTHLLFLTRDRGFAGSNLTGALWSLSKTHLSYLRTGSTQEDQSLFN